MEKKRTANFTTKEKIITISIIEKYKNIIESKETCNAALRLKNETWKKVCEEFNAESEIPRDVQQIKNLYFNMKRKPRKNKAYDDHRREYLKALQLATLYKAEFHKTGKDYQPYLNDIGSHLLAAFKDQSKSLQYNDQMNEEYPLINPDPDTPTVTGLPNPYEDDNISFSTDSSNPMKDTYVSVKPDPDTPMVTGLSDSYDNDDMSYKTDNIEPDIQLSIKPDPDTPMVTDLTNPYDNADTSYSTDHNDPMTDTPPSPESDFVTPIASTCLQTIVPDSDPESQKPPSVLKRKFKKQLNYKDLYYKKMYELACFELKSKKVIHTLDVKIKKKQLEQLEN